MLQALQLRYPTEGVQSIVPLYGRDSSKDDKSVELKDVLLALRALEKMKAM